MITPSQAQLACGHLLAAPLLEEGERRPRALPCFACAAALPRDEVIVKAAMREASPEKRDEYAGYLDELRGKKKCKCLAEDAVFCALDKLLDVGFDREASADFAFKYPCRCAACHEGGAA